MATISQYFPNKKENSRNAKAVKSSAVHKAVDVKAAAVVDVKPDVRQEDLKMLKEFDLHWEFGPCAGVTRLERWERARKHGLNPSQAVKDLILRHPDDTEYTHSLWNTYAL